MLISFKVKPLPQTDLIFNQIYEIFILLWSLSLPLYDLSLQLTGKSAFCF